MSVVEFSDVTSADVTMFENDVTTFDDDVTMLGTMRFDDESSLDVTI